VSRDRKPRRLRKLLVLGALAALVVLAVIYARCGGGFGLGGGGGAGLSPGSGSGSASASAVGSAKQAPPPRCQVRVDATGIHVDGKEVDQAGAVAACKPAAAADVLVTGDATQGTWDALRAALDQAGVATYVLSSTEARDAR
jgi:hypothetical protein